MTNLDLDAHAFAEYPGYDYDHAHPSFIQGELYNFYCEKYGKYIEPAIFEEWIYEENLDEFEIDNRIAQMEVQAEIAFESCLEEEENVCAN